MNTVTKILQKDNRDYGAPDSQRVYPRYEIEKAKKRVDPLPYVQFERIHTEAIE